MSYSIWVPFLFCHCLLQTWLAIKNSNGQRWAFWCLWLTGIIPIWSFISKHSKNLIFDGTLYDLIMTMTYIVGMLWFTGASDMTKYKWAGLIFITIGFILLKVNFKVKSI